ncbi:hypothetical protein ACIQUQ_22150 [Streptomyces sp. NPDC101118]|uniref:hypothetical protein n=1 Tax=unclassified Streptomyces TaxID=2593676 RepID=UPI0037D4EE2B
MTMLQSAPSTGRRRKPTSPGYEESVQHHPADPPIYRALLARWATDGRTLPGRRDPEWSRLTSSPVWPGGRDPF